MNILNRFFSIFIRSRSESNPVLKHLKENKEFDERVKRLRRIHRENTNVHKKVPRKSPPHISESYDRYRFSKWDHEKLNLKKLQKDKEDKENSRKQTRRDDGDANTGFYFSDGIPPPSSESDSD